MRREFTYDGRTYGVDGARSEWLLRFWDDGGVDLGFARNRVGVGIDELTDGELCLHLAEASTEQTQGAATARRDSARASVSSTDGAF